MDSGGVGLAAKIIDHEGKENPENHLDEVELEDVSDDVWSAESNEDLVEEYMFIDFNKYPFESEEQFKCRLLYKYETTLGRQFLKDIVDGGGQIQLREDNSLRIIHKLSDEEIVCHEHNLKIKSYNVNQLYTFYRIGHL